MKKTKYGIAGTVFFISLLSVVALHIPFIGGVWGLLTLGPFTSVFPEFAKTGEHVEYGFLWLIVKSFYAWTVLVVYYASVWFFLFGLFKLIKSLHAKVSP
ncbi:hypothetical protein LJ739_08810 [Aestuariibacter halophilus]|uniref:Uncharacterized protein n=1 Tax=Fluctibacter halophilus TaxID=226011 RepID=A0ABS8G7D6_9ALTE|nr:hypothetical protein [Aestuariibacter halophilus]MCC2616338.1 hypothetical protein [Aestuariibacter halophilus]